MLVAQISDPHITDRQGDLPVDSGAQLARVVEHINDSEVPIDLVVATGDLTNDATALQYELLTSHLSQFTPRVVVLPGNHDDNELARTSLDGFLPGDLAEGHLSYVINDYPVRLVCLDTSMVGRHDGVFDDQRAGWLDQVLGESSKPTLVFMHHPAVRVGIRFMDLMALDDPERFEAVISRHTNVLTVASGHLHRSFTSRIGHAVAVGAPSTSHQVNLNLDPSRAGLIREPAAYLLHFWDGTRLVSHTAQVADFKVAPMDDFVAVVEKAAVEGDGIGGTTASD